jgi:hypothetical protein
VSGISAYETKRMGRGREDLYTIITIEGAQMEQKSGASEAASRADSEGIFADMISKPTLTGQLLAASCVRMKRPLKTTDRGDHVDSAATALVSSAI